MHTEEEQKPVFSVSEFVDYINLALGRRIVVEGEVSSYSMNHGKWIFFDLKDENSKVNCFAAAWNLHTAIEDGMTVQVTGTPRMYGKTGKFSITVDSVELKGVGALKRAFELTKVKLEKEGLFDVARKRSLPLYPKVLGLICSRESAAYTDFMRILNQRWGGVTIHLAHVHVQGDSAVSEISGAFEWFNQYGGELDVESIILIRGGGSLEDLQAFNSETVARAVFGSRFPVICGVGHERDESLADYVADVRAATPTHAASLVAPNRDELFDRISFFQSALTQSLENLLEWHDSAVARHMATLQNVVQGHMHHFNHVVNQLNFNISAFEGKLTSLAEGTGRSYEMLTMSLEWRIVERRTGLSSLERTFSSLNPLTVLKRGYSIVKRRGRVVVSKTQLKSGDVVDVQFSDGSLPAIIDSPQGKLL